MPTGYTWPVYPAEAASRPGDIPAAELVAYGVDLFYNGRMVVGPAGDYLEVAAEENLRRSIFRRLITRPGEYRLRPGYGAGLLDAVKRPATRARMDELTARVRDQALRDRRVEKVLEVTITAETFGGQPGLRVVVRVQAFGKTLRPLSYGFTREVT